jgi:hypothetical protein
MRHAVTCLALLALSAVACAADAPRPATAPITRPAAPTTRDTARGDRMLADYFRTETAALADRCLADVRTLDDWTGRRDKYRRQLADMLGLWPTPPKTDLKPVVHGTIDHPEFTVERLSFQSRPGLYVTANLYVPKGLTQPAPAILYVCGHAPVKDKQAGVSYGNKTAYQHHGEWFARNGYVCLVPDTLELGEIEGIHHGTYDHGMWRWLSRIHQRGPAGWEYPAAVVRNLGWPERRLVIRPTLAGSFDGFTAQ